MLSLTDMLIGYLISQYPAGSHTFIRREIDELRRRGVDVQTFSIRRPAADECHNELDWLASKETFYVLPVALTRLIAAHFAAVCRKPRAYCHVAALAFRHRAPGLRALVWSVFHFLEAIVLARELERRGVQHLHNHFANSGATVGLLASRFLGVPWSMTLHGISETDYPAGLLLGKKVEYARFVSCVSHFGRAQAMRLTSPDHWNKLFIARCGVNLDGMPESRFPQRRARIICVGRLSPEKGQVGLIDAFAAMRIDGVQAELVLVGDGPERRRLEEKVTELGLEASVTLKGRLDEQSTLVEIASSDLLTLPSFMEGLPVVLMEAMALGIPVVAPRLAGIPELVADGEEGLLFRPADWADLGEKMVRLLRDRSLRRRIITAARAKVEAEFDIGRAIRPLLARFKAPIEAGPKSTATEWAAVDYPLRSERRTISRPRA